MPGVVLDHLANVVPAGARLGLLGVTYKADVDDIRESPALRVAELAVERGYDVRLCDPHLGSDDGGPPTRAAAAHRARGARRRRAGPAGRPQRMFLKQLDLDLLAALVRRKLVFDARGALDIAAWRQHGFEVEVLGGGTPPGRTGRGAARVTHAAAVRASWLATRRRPGHGRRRRVRAGDGACASSTRAAIPATYALRLIPWALVGGVQAIAVGRLAARLQRPHGPLADRPVMPFIVAGLVSVVVVLGINRLLPVGFTLPTSVAVIGPLLASAGVAALHVAGRTAYVRAGRPARATRHPARRRRLCARAQRQARADHRRGWLDRHRARPAGR